MSCSECNIQTPNFALNPEDVPTVEDGPAPSNRVTLQFLKPPDVDEIIRPRDARFAGTPRPRDENVQPPAILLDFMYGAAAYKRWGNGPEMKYVIHSKFVEQYQSISSPQRRMDPPGGDSGSEPESDDPTDGDYVDPGSSKRNHARWPQDSLVDVMDDMNDLIMRANGITPEMRMKGWQKEEEEEKLKNE